METLLIYILKASAILGIFYLCYIFLLRKETSFQLNRNFLNAGLLTSAILPSVYFTKVVYIKATTSSLDFIPITTEGTHVPIEASIDWWHIAGLIYLLITGFFLLRLGLQLSSVLHLLLTNKVEKTEGFKILKTSENQLPFSFFNFIVFNPGKHSPRDLDLILEHEKVHARQLHSADILLANLASCLLWFNPFVWLYKKSVEQNLEFIADRETVNTKAQIKEYQHALVKVSIADLRPALTNHFYQSFIKKRIIMLNKKSSTNSPAWKLSLVIPLILAFLLAFNVKTEAQVIENEEPEQLQKPAEIAEPQEEKEHMEEAETEEEIEAIEEPEEMSVEVVEAPEVRWVARSATRQTNPVSELGNDPLYILNGKKFKASRLNNKYIGLDSRLEVLTGEKAISRYGEDARNGAIIIPDAEIIRNFDREMKRMRELENYSARYILVGSDGKPNFVDINSNTSTSPASAIHFSAYEPVYAVSNIKTWETRTVPKAQNTYIIRNAGSTSANSNENVTYEFKSGDSKTTSYSFSGKAPVAYSTSSDVKIISQDGEPLYVVDGKVQGDDFDKRDLKPSNIAHINVLKGDMAIEKYGNKAKNGVVEISTKPGVVTIYTKDSKYNTATNAQLVKIHAGMNDAQLEQAKSKLKELTGIELSIENVSRNDGLITSIRIKSTLDGKQISNGHFEDTNSIPNIYVGLVDGKAVIKSSRD